MSTGKLLTLSETEEELRQLSWLMRITRDQVLSVAEAVPADFRERVEGMAERLVGVSAELRRLMTLLPEEPAGLPEPVRVDVGLAGLRLSVDRLLVDVTSLMIDLKQLAEDLGDGAGVVVH